MDSVLRQINSEKVQVYMEIAQNKIDKELNKKNYLKRLYFRVKAFQFLLIFTMIAGILNIQYNKETSDLYQFGQFLFGIPLSLLIVIWVLSIIFWQIQLNQLQQQLKITLGRLNSEKLGIQFFIENKFLQFYLSVKIESFLFVNDYQQHLDDSQFISIVKGVDYLFKDKILEGKRMDNLVEKYGIQQESEQDDIYVEQEIIEYDDTQEDKQLTQAEQNINKHSFQVDQNFVSFKDRDDKQVQDENQAQPLKESIIQNVQGHTFSFQQQQEVMEGQVLSKNDNTKNIDNKQNVSIQKNKQQKKDLKYSFQDHIKPIKKDRQEDLRNSDQLIFDKKQQNLYLKKQLTQETKKISQKKKEEENKDQQQQTIKLDLDIPPPTSINAFSSMTSLPEEEGIQSETLKSHIFQITKGFFDRKFKNHKYYNQTSYSDHMLAVELQHDQAKKVQQQDKSQSYQPSYDFENNQVQQEVVQQFQ